MPPLETLIEDYLADLVRKYPYIEVSDLFLDEDRVFIRGFADAIRELWDDIGDVGHE